MASRLYRIDILAPFSRGLGLHTGYCIPRIQYLVCMLECGHVNPDSGGPRPSTHRARASRRHRQVNRRRRLPARNFPRRGYIPLEPGGGDRPLWPRRCGHAESPSMERRRDPSRSPPTACLTAVGVRSHQLSSSRIVTPSSGLADTSYRWGPGNGRRGQRRRAETPDERFALRDGPARPGALLAACARVHAQRWLCINIRLGRCMLGRAEDRQRCGELLIPAHSAADRCGQ